MFFFFKQMSAYEMRISDWGSDVCSSDLVEPRPAADHGRFLAQQVSDVRGVGQQRSGDVAAADVLGQGPGDIDFDLRGRRGGNVLGHAWSVFREAGHLRGGARLLDQQHRDAVVDPIDQLLVAGATGQSGRASGRGRVWTYV